jgi:amidase
MTDAFDPLGPATAMLTATRAGRISSAELLAEHRRRIELFNPTLNAIVEPDFARAADAAAQADRYRRAGHDAPLLGLPMTLKESINVAGLRTTVGMQEWAGIDIPWDAPLTSALRRAGAVVMAKTNVPPMLLYWQTVNPVYGRTVNPWDPSRSPGGSTGGGAAALAAGLTPLEFGSDLGGSIRVPAAFCGVYGHRPSETAMPKYGQYPAEPLPNAADFMGVIGPLARSAEDLELALDVAAGPALGEDVAWRITLPPARHERLAEYRVAVLPPLDWIPVDPEIRAAESALAERLRSVGCRVETVSPDGLGDFRRNYELYMLLRAVVHAARMTPYERQERLEIYRTRDDEWSRVLQRGMLATGAEFVGWIAERERVRAAWRAFFRDWDVLLTPAWLGPAFPHMDPFWPVTPETIARTIEIDGRRVLFELGLFYPSVSTVAGQPSTAFPVGRTSTGLPIGLQAVGPYLEDRTPIRFAALVGREWGGFSPPPGYESA